MTRQTYRLVTALAVALAVAVAGIIYIRQSSPAPERDDAAASDATFVGSRSCASCHGAEAASWEASQHRQAMQDANDRTVLGNFRNARFSYNGVESSFFRRDDGFWVRTDGPDGALADFRIRYTFGVAPLQQYLVEFPDGRIQALSIAWDTRPTADGGQRWFHLYADQTIDYRDELHWTGRQQNWNFMCADCHSTNVRKGYDASKNRFNTTWSEISVGCESCHGPGSNHVAWASAGAWQRRWFWNDNGLTVSLDERRGVNWRIDPSTLKPLRSTPRTSAREIEVCATCHSRRAQVSEGFVAGSRLDDFYAVAPLARGLYHPDGQQLDEVYTYGSFLQSRMHASGVTCSDCHEPHGGRLRETGDALCERCHAASKYASAPHTLHEAATRPTCVACHMPARAYMGIDARRDHSFRIPRPDRSVTMGVPNACDSCHADKGARWAADRLRQHLGRDPGGFQTFAESFAAADRITPGANAALAALVTGGNTPAIVKAAALDRLASAPDPAMVSAAQAALSDPDPMVRRLGLRALDRLPPSERLVALVLLEDRVRAVRLEAARILAPARPQLPDATRRASFERALAELLASLRLHADRPESRLALALLYGDLGQVTEAAGELRAAIALDRGFVPAYVNLADLLGRDGREAEADQTLRDGLRERPDSADLHHSLGLSLARAGRYGDAVTELGRAAELQPDAARFHYAYAVALNSTGRSGQAIAVVERARTRHPGDRDLLIALATFQRDAGRPAQARAAASELLRRFPEDADARELAASLAAPPAR